MKVIAINGGPRKGWNTHTLLEKALEGARSNGAETQMVNLYDLNYKGCIGCLGCKLKSNEARCVINDALKPVLDACHTCDAIVLGSPIYLNEVTGELRSFIERLLFQYISYDKMGETMFTGHAKSAVIFTTNCPEPAYDKVGYTQLFGAYKQYMERFYGNCRTLAVSETLQTHDYDKYRMAMFDVPDRQRRRKEVFPQDCEKAYELGRWLAE